ncbi:hypothetical protein NUACC26_085910 [Scytonema sp. NUACC26]
MIYFTKEDREEKDKEKDNDDWSYLESLINEVLNS